MLTTPEYLSLLALIKQLFTQQDELTEQKQQLIEWAQRVKLLQLQSVGDGVSATLVSDLEQQMPQMIVLAVELSQKDISPALIEALQQEIELFYQQVKQIDKTYSDEQLLENWQGVATNHKQAQSEEVMPIEQDAHESQTKELKPESEQEPKQEQQHKQEIAEQSQQTTEVEKGECEEQIQKPQHDELTQNKAKQIDTQESINTQGQSSGAPVLNEATLLNASLTQNYESHLKSLFE